MKEKKVQFKKVRAWIKTVGSTYTGTLYLPKDNTRISDLMNDERQFLSLTNVDSKDFASPKAYLAINKDLIELVEILDPDLERES
ncbi:MAG: hypothetical protein ACM3N7_05465 [Planctomycetaceae bacterium]